MEPIQQELNNHKNKLLNLINNLINTQIIFQEILLNNEIKKECEFINSLLNIKQNTLMQQNIQNMNFNLNMFQNNMMIGMNEPQMNIIPIHNLNEFDNNNNNIYNKMFVIFKDIISGKQTSIQCQRNDKISDINEKYRQKINNFSNKLVFSFNSKFLNNSSTVEQEGITDGRTILVIHSS